MSLGAWAARCASTDAVGVLGETKHQLVEVQGGPLHDQRELGGQSAGDVAGEAVVAGDGRDVQGDDAVGRQPVAAQLEEVGRGQVERHVRLAVGVDEDEVVLLLGRLQKRAGVGADHTKTDVIGLAEVLLCDGVHSGIDLHPVDSDIGIVDAERAGGRPPRVAQDGDALDRTVHERGHREEHVPFAAGENRARAPDGVHRKALVEVEQSGIVLALYHLDELVTRLLLVDKAGGGLDGAGRDGHEPAEHHRHHQPAPAQKQAGRGRDDGRRPDERPLRPDEGNGHKRREERAHQAAGRGQGEDAARG